MALLAHPSGEQLFMLLDRMVRAMGSVPQSQTTMSAMLTMLATSAVFLFDGGCAVALLFILVCGVALLQSKLIKAAGDWTSSYLLGGRMGGEPPHELRLPGALGLLAGGAPK